MPTYLDFMFLSNGTKFSQDNLSVEWLNKFNFLKFFIITTIQ